MAKLLHDALFTKAIMTFGLTKEMREVISAYEMYDRFEDRKAALKLGRSICGLNRVVKEHNFGQFVLKAIQSDDEMAELSLQAYNAINALVASATKDSYTSATAKPATVKDGI